MNRVTTTGLVLAAAAGVGTWLLSRARARGQFTFHNKIAIVTGGSRGLGLVVARELARRGARVAVCARNSEQLDQAARDIARYGAPPLAMACDITQQDDVRRFVAA